MTIVVIPDIRDLGTVPNNNMEESVYNATAEAFTGQMPGWGADNKAVAEAGRTNALHAASAADSASSSAGTANGRAEAASASAGTASAKAGEAADSASSAAASLAAMQKLYLGNKAAHPAVDNQGAALQKGAWYTNSANSYWYWWNGVSWIVGVGDLNAVDWATQVINKPTLVNSVNGRTGAVAGLVEKTISLPNNSDLNSVLESGFYRLTSTHLHAPSINYPYSQMRVERGEDTATQEVTSYDGLDRAWRGGQNLNGVPIWSDWQRVLGDHSLIERGKYVNAPGSTYVVDPKEASVQVIDVNAPLTLSIVNPRKLGDQLTLMLSFVSAQSIVFSSNVKPPSGGIRVGVSGNILTIALVARQDNFWLAYEGGLHPW